MFPKETTCCRGFRIDPRASSVKIFDINGINNGINYHGMCKGCKTTYYYSYTQSGDVRVFKNDVQNDIFSVTSSIAMSKRLLTRFELQASIGFTSFQKMATIYNEETNTSEINAQLIEEHYFLYRITKFKIEIPWHRKKTPTSILKKYVKKRTAS